MAVAQSSIEWTDSTWSPLTGCTKVSPGCDHCYAEAMHERFNGKGSFATVTLRPERLTQPLKWRKRRRIFVNSMSDLFHQDVPDEFIARVFAVMAATPRHTYQVLTKRHARMRSLLNNYGWWTRVAAYQLEYTDEPSPTQTQPNGCALLNVWLGVSVEDQHWADIRIPALLGTPAAVRWISAEPLLGPADLMSVPPRTGCIPALDWVVVGGESGPKARPMHPQWVRDLRDQCTAAGVPYFFKQWGAWAPTGAGGVGVHLDTTPAGYIRTPVRHDPNVRYMGAPYTIHRTKSGTEIPYSPEMRRVGKRAAGRELDGRTWDEFPRALAGAA